jgi:transcriptional regulator with XRE-family HTH domain
MGENTKPGSVLRDIGAELLAARRAAGMSQRELAKVAEISSISRISEMETGIRRLRVAEYERIMDALAIADLDDRERIIGAAQAAEGPGQLGIGPAAINEIVVQLIDHERAARRITDGALALLPGLLQTDKYSAAVFGHAADTGPRVALRAGRQRILTGSNPIEFHALIDSEALTRPVVPPSEMADQLRHILDLTALPNVTVQVLPSTTPGYHPLLSGPFELIEFAKAGPIVLLDHHHHSLFLRDPKDVRVYVEVAEQLRNAVAMTPEASVEFIAEIVKGMEAT